MSDGCKHYLVLFNHDSCAAGVNYKEHAGGAGPGWLKRLPCHRDGGDALPCAKRETYTPAEKAARDDELLERVHRALTAEQACRAHAKGKRSVAGNIKCPNCDGTLRYSIASNGHCHGRCSTDGCASWMQ